MSTYDNQTWFITWAQLWDLVSVKHAFNIGSLDKNKIVDSNKRSRTFIIPNTSCPTCLMMKAFKINVTHLNKIWNTHVEGMELTC